MRVLLGSCLVLSGVVCTAQSVTTAVVGSAMTAGATGPGGVPNFATQPAGPLPLPGVFSHTAFGGGAQITWGTDGTPTNGGTTTFRHELGSSTTPADFAATGTFTLEYTASAPVLAALYLFSGSVGSSGAPIPAVDVDFGADGTFELQSVLGPVFEYGTWPISPAQPLRLAIRMQTTLPANHLNITSFVEVTLAPVNNADATHVAVECASTATFLRPRASFANSGIDFTYLPPASPLVVVIGLAAQPVMLPPVGLVPCLLVPRPDILLFAPPPTSSHHIPLPPAVRPVTFFVQGVVLDPSGLQTTDGFAVSAF